MEVESEGMMVFSYVKTSLVPHMLKAQTSVVSIFGPCPLGWFKAFPEGHLPHGCVFSEQYNCCLVKRRQEENRP